MASPKNTMRTTPATMLIQYWEMKARPSCGEGSLEKRLVNAETNETWQTPKKESPVNR